MPRRVTQTVSSKSSRYTWGNTYKVSPPLDLLAIQKQSYVRFLKEGIKETLEEISPVDDFTGKNWSLTLAEYRIGKPPVSAAIAMTKGLTYDAPLYVKTVLVNKKSEKEYKHEVFLGDIPQMTDSGTFIVNGVERAVVNQLVRSPGVFFTAIQDATTGKTLYSAEIRPVHGSWLEFTTTRYGTITVKIDRRKKFLASTFLRAIGIS